MSRLQTQGAEFARKGFNDPEAAEKILQDWIDRSGAVPNISIELFDLVGDPDQALCALNKLHLADPELTMKVLSDSDWLTRVLAIFGGSIPLGQFLISNPNEIYLLEAVHQPKSSTEWLSFFANRLGQKTEPWSITDSDAADRLRLINKAALCLVAGRDLTSPNPETIVESVSAELAGIADAVLKAAFSIAIAEVAESDRARLGVIALGKCGAQELNYLSDVDVIYVAEPADNQTSVEHAIEIATKIVTVMTKVCSALTPMGSIWQLDANLRPEGAAGPLVRTLKSHQTYYQKWARNWEFQALLKARPAAGDLSLGKDFCDLVAPLVWQAGERENFIAEAQDMRKRVVSLIPAQEADREIKLSSGGLRDTEFSVQLLQLVHGRADKRLQVRSTYVALQQLVAHGYIGRDHGAQLEADYKFQRVLENRIQLYRLRRTHLLPDNDSELKSLARTMRLANMQELIKTWHNTARNVRKLSNRIFYSPLLEAVARIGSNELKLSTNAAMIRLKALGFTDPQHALDHIEALTNGHSRAVEIQRQLLPALLGWFAEGPNADYGLLAFRQLSEDLGSTHWYLKAMRDEGFMAQRMARICSSSRYVVGLLRQAPESVQIIANDHTLVPSSLKELLATMLSQIKRHEDPGKAIAAVRATRRRELARIAIADLLGLISYDAVGKGLSDLATASIEAALEISSRQAEIGQIGVIAMGRWGGEELSYSSDADVMYVIEDGCKPEDIKKATLVLRKMSDLLRAPSLDPSLEIDVDLRPEGKGGPLVRTLGSYLNYYQRWSSTWEAQALVRARPGAGNLELCQQVLDAADNLRWPKDGLSRQQLVEIRKLKLRMEAERIPRGSIASRNLKLGPGGLSDVEWTVQILQMKYAHGNSKLRAQNILVALAELENSHFLSSEDANDLKQAWILATKLRNAIMLVRARPSDSLPSDSRDLAAIAAILGYGRGETSQLLDDYAKAARKSRVVVDKYFWEEN